MSGAEWSLDGRRVMTLGTLRTSYGLNRNLRSGFLSTFSFLGSLKFGVAADSAFTAASAR